MSNRLAAAIKISFTLVYSAAMCMLCLFSLQKMSLSILQLALLLQVIWAEHTYGRLINVDLINGINNEDCLSEQIPCSSLEYAVTNCNLTSDDYINITSDTVSLPIMVKLGSLNNITIRGHGNTIVKCDNIGGLSCNGCSNVVIEGITWDQCGDPNQQNPAYPNAFGGLNFTNVTNLSINNCTLQNSRVRALSLYLIAGFINIRNTHFINNSNYDTIYCFQGPVYIHCVTDNRNVTGALYIEDATSDANIIVYNCDFSNNGHFGEVLDNSPTNTTFELSEIADGPAIKVLQTDDTVPISVAVEKSIFFCNRGRSGGAVNIKVFQSESLNFNNVSFLNNSVIRAYVNSSALMVFVRNTSSTISISSSNFQSNYGGRNMIGYIIAGQPSNVYISNCKFLDNRDYEVGLVELNMQSQSVVKFVDSLLANNTGNALLYVQLRSSNINVSLHGLRIINNTGSSVLRRGGLLSFRLLEDDCIVNISRLIYTTNSYSRNGGGVYITGFFRNNFSFCIQDAQFESNIGHGQGAIIYSILISDNVYVFTIYNSTFVNNTGDSIVRIGKTPLMEDLIIKNTYSVLLLGKATKFLNNSGTAITLSDSILVGNENTKFMHNRAESGGGFYLIDSYVLPHISSFQFDFIENFALVHGGAIFIEFTLQCGWLLNNTGSSCDRNDCPCINDDFYNNLPHDHHSDTDNFQACHFNYVNNSVFVAGSDIFYDVPDTTPAESLIFDFSEDHCGINSSSRPRRLATQPKTLKLKAPAICLDDDCSSYFVNGITLGQEIRIPAQTIGYNNEPAEATVFFVTCIENCSTIDIVGRRPVLINDQLSDIHIIGGKNASTVKLQLSSDTITVNLTIELAPCSPGLVYDSNTRKCECFTKKHDIISCSPKTTIQRDYWFGAVDGITTVSLCPNGYCNFSRKRDINASGEFLLSPIQDDQCNPHRTGQACGECDPNYTLSYDSVDCVSIDDCHYRYIIAVVVWTVTYWILVIILVFALMRLIIYHLKYGNGIGYLYGIIYYYSVVDILLGQILNFSDGLSTSVSILSIFFKLNPGFDLFKFCFAEGMQRIDQYFINYIHSAVILLFLLLLVRFIRTKYSRKLMALIGKSIIPTICLILTIAYTSIADTSLQILRYINFVSIDGVYVYLSPSIKYCTGRHVVYFIIALLHELLIVVGLPLLLIISRWTNEVNLIFVHIDLKPIFDQFQGCYKDEYRWFAAVYLICRQIILIIVVINFSDYYVELYLLTIVCLIAAILHYSIQPYKNNILNKLDGCLLQLLLLVISLQMAAFSNGFTVDAVEGVAYTLLLLPIAFILIGICLLILKIWLAKKTSVSDALRMEPLLSNNHTNTSTEINIK